MQPNYDKTQRTHQLRAWAAELGFMAVGIARAEELTEEARRLELWLSQGRQGKMQYLENHFEKRIDPRKLVEGTRSVVSLVFNYYNPEKQSDAEAPKIAMYAYGRDYHLLLRERLNTLLQRAQSEWGGEQIVQGRGFVDSAPILERQWAQRAGLGWQGKNTLLLSKKRGSYFFLAELLLNQELIYDAPTSVDHCGTCRRCIEACPTQAISPEGYILDSNRCISYLTIELKEAIAEEFRPLMQGWAFGCDVCQQVCPWNRFSQPHSEKDLLPPPTLLGMTRKDWQELQESSFKQLFANSAVKRTKYIGLRRNIDFVASADNY